MADDKYLYYEVREKSEPEYNTFEHDSLIAGCELKIDRSVYSNTYDITALTQKTPEELQTLFDDSAGNEQKAFQIVLAAVGEWEKQAAITQRYLRALKYIEIPEPEHTGNQWTTDRDGWRNISNKVYKFTCRLEEDTHFNFWKSNGMSPRWRVRWNLYTNSPVYGMSTRIAGQDRQFKDKAEAERYLNGRIAAYAKLFTELSPPIPKEYASAFRVSSTLLPGYQVEGEARQPERPSVLGQLSENKKQAAETPKPPTAPKKQPER